VAIAGTAGIGKSALALHFARVLRGSYPGGQLYARLRGASTEPVAPAAVLALPDRARRAGG
jgi:predicted ATPase